MPKFKRSHWIPLAVICCGLAAFSASFLFPSVFLVCAHNEATGLSDCASHHFGPYLVFGLGVLIDEHNGFVTALASVVMALFSGVLWFVTNESVRLANAEFNATHRPQLEVRFVREVSSGVEVTVINTGTSSAIFVAARAITRRINDGEPLPSPHDIPPEASFELRKKFFPSESDTFVVTYAGSAFEEGFGGPLHVFGWIVYETIDANPIRRTTYFGRKSELFRPELVPIEGSDWNLIQ